MSGLWTLLPKQKEMLQEINSHKYVLCIGGGRTGKTLSIVVKMFSDAIKYPNTTQAIFRNTLSSAVDGIWKKTVKEVIGNFFPALPLMHGFKLNESNHEIIFPNGSRIVLKGLDNTEKVQKLLSTQFMRCFIDEAHLVKYEHFGMLMTRVPQPLDVSYKVSFVFAANWCPKTHWLKTFFEDGLNPETKNPHNQDVALISSRTEDNTTIDAAEYLSTLNMAGDRRSRLACAGNNFYDVVDGALWEQSDILRAEPLEYYDEVVLAFDPSISNSSNNSADEHGICIAGKLDGKYYVIMSYEEKADINIIARTVCELYHLYNCNTLIYEGNNGGKWIDSLIRQYDKKVYIKEVRAKVGKILRAEPIAALYKNGLVYHCGAFDVTEDQMLTFSGLGRQDSPNALDALVYALKYLTENSSYVDPNDI